MLRSLRAAEQAMNVRQTQIATLANNLANVDAAGFRQVLTRVTERGASGQDDGGETAAAPTAAPARLLPPTPAGWARETTVQLQAALDVRPGALRTTGRPGDLALQGDGFFVVQTEQGEMYTRNGRFSLDRDGRLVTSQGDPVLGAGGPLEIPGGEFTLTRDGAVLAAGAEVGRLQVVRFADASRLTHRGHALLAAPRDLPAEPVPPDQVDIAQGMLEGSNVNPIDTLVAMIAAQRAFEIEAKVLQANDENLEKSVNALPSTR